ncbi:MAG TPA: response regulator [Blattabacteriaceae bacterium]|jgi:DNA-binding response OmpR family regulator|nr:response regulator [Blattabacteriaceae bacterium]
MPSVLLVDPEPGVIVTLKMILERDGYSVSTATSYSTAAALLHDQSWDVLITELDLEAEALGLRLAGEAKSLQHRPAIFVYASYPDVERLRAALALHIDYCGFKPLEVEEIRKVVRLLVARNCASRNRGLQASRQR